MLLDSVHKSESFLIDPGLRMPAMPFCLASAVAVGGSLGLAGGPLVIMAVLAVGTVPREEFA